ncbi:N5,N10-methylene tetrahydromethanopterin reductase [Devosia pacifica]|uniref:Luciferase-like monooxygenase n=1 Tax=Devosia pacifica TaxID=1335967 RepID=A0A918S4Z0_9HYPH|nr:LLM class flavin-dependent oxidoreductase [Devosia pacifica]GHA24659.1 N5,N10-methylene tetrahydromethanopterin reductase [Devosia pacifica]
MTAPFELSILDLAPIAEGTDTPTALAETARLAQTGEAYGYTRLWFAEHHGMPSIGSASPEVLIANAAAATRKIRVGSGGVMLLNHAPLRIVEAFRTLEALNPGRIDLGLGRAPGGDGYAMRALRTGGGEEFSNYLAEMLAFEEDGFPSGHPLSRVRVAPGGVSLPPLWLLGSSGASAEAAGQMGMGYAFAAHFSQAPGRPAFEAYKRAFTPSASFSAPRGIVCVSVICAETDEEAEYLAGSQALSWALFHSGELRKLVTPEEAAAHEYTDRQKAIIAQQRPLWIVGSPQTVKAAIEEKQAETGADEVMITTQMHSYEKRRESFRLISEAFGLVAKAA